MSLVKIKNPKTTLYKELKKKILGHKFEWVYADDSLQGTDESIQDGLREIIRKKYIKEQNELDQFEQFPLYAHNFLQRSDSNFLYTQIKSKYINDINQMYCEILNHNIDIIHHQYQFNMMCRCAANTVIPCGEQTIKCFPHYDHNFPHKNMLIYLTDSGGRTFVEGEEFAPEEDDVIIFEGIHWHELPKQERRVVLVMTYI